MLRKYMFIVDGPPNSGKGSFSTEATRCLDVGYLGAGDICREEKKNNTALWRDANTWMTKTQSTLWPTDLFMQALIPRVNELAPRHQFVLLDGVLRKPDQVPKIVQLYCQNEFDHLVVTAIRTDFDECRRRALGRARPDDKDIDRRLSDYRNETVPAVRELIAHPDIDGQRIVLYGDDMHSHRGDYIQGLHHIYKIPLRVSA